MDDNKISIGNGVAGGLRAVGRLVAGGKSRALHAFRAWLPSLQLTWRLTSGNTLNRGGKKCPQKRSRNPEKQGYVTSSQIICVAAFPKGSGRKGLPK